MQLPEPRPGPGVRLPDRVQQPWLRRDPVDHPKRRRVRRHRPEQHLLLTNRTEISHTLAAVGQHHREIADHPARIMTATTLLDRQRIASAASWAARRNTSTRRVVGLARGSLSSLGYTVTRGATALATDVTSARATGNGCAAASEVKRD